MKINKILFLLFLITTVFLITKQLIHGKSKNLKLLYKPNNEFVSKIEKNVLVTTNPKIKYNYDFMNPGVIQHLDRNYTYDYIPQELEGGIIFQGIHRPKKGLSIKIELFKPALVFFFFHHSVDGGYTEIFKSLGGWSLYEDTPKYDIHNGDHGLNMIMYKLDATKGTYYIPPTLKDKACFNIVFKFK
ncbi:hypothetical protein [Pseudotamlana agarivorans]|uniref:hypothetical protein n=1 Tax=Pseudotamlana agarivorans TaxID=481183 RepID=UPI00082B0B29|nr:hypothetical protein [Tamlana agarivorans]